MINPKKLLGFEALSEGRFLCSGPGGQYILRPASPDEIGQKTELTLAIFADTPYIDARVAAFNSRSENTKSESSTTPPKQAASQTRACG